MPSLTKVQSGFVEAQGALPLSSGTAAAPGLKFDDHAGTGMFSPSTGEIAFSTSGHSQAVTFKTDGKVGIGTDSPEFALEVNNEIASKNANKEFIGIDLISNEARIRSSFYSGASGAYRPITFYTSDAERLRITTDGKLTAKSTHSNGAVNEALRITTLGTYSSSNSSNAGPAISFGQFDGDYPTWTTAQIAGIRKGTNWDGALVFYTNDGSSETDISEKLSITSDGKLTSTSLRTTAYDAAATTNDSSVVILNSGAAGHATLQFQSLSGGTANTGQATISVFNESSSSKNTALTFGTRQNSDSTIRERLRITSDGQVVINRSGAILSNSLSKLEVFNSTENLIFVSNSTAATGQDAGIMFAPANNVYGGKIIVTSDEDFSTSANRTAHMAFYTRKDGTAAERLRITSDGKVMMGKSSSSINRNLSITGVTGNSNDAEIGLQPTNSSGGINPEAIIGATADGAYGAHMFFTTRDTSGNRIERLRITSAGKVGINCTPTSKLSLETGSGGEYFLDVKGTAARQWGLYYDQNSWMDSTFRIDEFDNNGTATTRFSITDGGKVGIGLDSPVRKLQLHENSSSGCFLSITNNTTGSGSGDGALIGLQDDESLLISQKESAAIFFHTSNTSRAYFSSGGTFALIGGGSAASPAISLNGSAPAGSFSVSSGGNINVKGTTDGVMNLNTTDSRGTFIRFQQNGASHTRVGCAAGFGGGSFDKEDLGLQSQTGQIVFLNNGSTERMRIYETGQVNIVNPGGTTTTLSANGITQMSQERTFEFGISESSNYSACTIGASQFKIGAFTGSSSYYYMVIEAWCHHRGYTNGGYSEYKKWIVMVGDKFSSNLVCGSGNDNHLGLWDGSSGSNDGFNNKTTSGASMYIMVNPSCGARRTGRCRVRYYSSMPFVPDGTRTSSNTTVRSNQQSPFRGNVGSKPYIGNYSSTSSSANVHVSGGQLKEVTSSIRYKTNVEDLGSSYADNTIDNLRPVWYRSKQENTDDPADYSYYGLIAEEVAEVEPRLVNYTNFDEDYEDVPIDTYTDEEGEEQVTIERKLKEGVEPRPQSVQYDRLSVMLLDVIQRQKVELAALTARVTDLETNN